MGISQRGWFIFSIAFKLERTTFKPDERENGKPFSKNCPGCWELIGQSGDWPGGYFPTQGNVTVYERVPGILGTLETWGGGLDPRWADKRHHRLPGRRALHVDLRDGAGRPTGGGAMHNY